MYSHEDGAGDSETDGIVSWCSSGLPPDGGWAWAKTTFGKGLDAGIVWEIGESVGDTDGGPLSGWGEVAEKWGELLGAFEGAKWDPFLPFPVNLLLHPNWQPGGFAPLLLWGAGELFNGAGEPSTGAGALLLGGGTGEIAWAWWWWWWCRWWWWWWCRWWRWWWWGGLGRDVGEGEGALPSPPWRECCKMDDRRTCFTLPKTVLFRPRFLEWPLMVWASCFNLGVFPITSITDDKTVVGGATVEPCEFHKFIYKFCIQKENHQILHSKP